MSLKIHYFLFLRTDNRFLFFICQTCFPVFLFWRTENCFQKTIAKLGLKMLGFSSQYISNSNTR